jgi:hypothetical protein
MKCTLLYNCQPKPRRAAKASKLDLKNYVDRVDFRKGTSAFKLDEDFNRTIYIGSDIFNHRFGESGYLIEALHEFVHAQQFNRLLRKYNGNINQAYNEALYISHYDVLQYDKNEIIAEGLAL